MFKSGFEKIAGLGLTPKRIEMATNGFLGRAGLKGDSTVREKLKNVITNDIRGSRTSSNQRSMLKGLSSNGKIGKQFPEDDAALNLHRKNDLARQLKEL